MKEVPGEFFRDRRVQLLLGRFLSGDLKSLTPILDPNLGHYYPDVEGLMDTHAEADILMKGLEVRELISRQACGVLVRCPKCGLFRLENICDESQERKSTRRISDSYQPEPGIRNVKDSNGPRFRCLDCGNEFGVGEAHFLPVSRYEFCPKSIKSLSEWLVVSPVSEFLKKRDYDTRSPGAVVGESGVKHTFDIVASGGDSGESIIVLDFALSGSPVGEDAVTSLFAKAYDANPSRAILAVYPSLTESAKKLAEKYRIAVLELGDARSLEKGLLKIVPTVDKAGLKALDVMDLFSLPDHLRSTAVVVSRLGDATAAEVSSFTNRLRAVESNYLNQLVSVGFLRKRRNGRRVVFSRII